MDSKKQGNKQRVMSMLGPWIISLAVLPVFAIAQAFPARPLTLIVPFTAGGATDVLARLIAQELGEELKQTVIVENLPGAGGSIGQGRVAKSTPDGHTLLLGNVGTLAASASLYRDLPYNVLQDFIPLASVGDAPQVLSVRADFPANTLDEFAAYACNHAATMNAGTAGLGSGSFLGVVVLNAALGVSVRPVHYRGAAQTVADVMAGHIDYTIESSSTAVASIASGKIKGLVVMRAQRVAVLPDVPAAAETAFPNLHYDIWNMMLVPKGVAPAVVRRLNQALNHILLNSVNLKARYAKMGLAVPVASHRSLEGARALLTSEVQRWQELLAAADIEAETK